MLNDPSDELSALLDPGEKLLWSGQPPRGFLLRGSDIFLIPFSLLWGGFAFFWEGSVLEIFFSGRASHAGPIRYLFALWGLPFVAVGCYLIFGRFLVDRAQRRRTFYGLTDRRVIICSGLFSRTTKSLLLRTLSDVTLSEKANGTGTITLGSQAGFPSWVQGSSWPGMAQQAAPVLDHVPEAKTVYEILRRAQAAT